MAEPTASSNKKDANRLRKLFSLFVPLVFLLGCTLFYSKQVEKGVLESLSALTQFEGLPPINVYSESEDNESKPDDDDDDASIIKEPLNIVLFYADDWTMKVLGKLNKDVYTPNIDKMADNGIMFTNNCVTTSICWISRASFFTGTYFARHRQMLPFDETLFQTHPWNETLFPLLKSNGYHTGLVGKWHAAAPGKYLDQAFDYRNMYYGSHWMNRGGKQRHVTELNEEDSIHFLKTRPKDKKFALKVSFFATHAEDGQYPSYKPTPFTKENLYTNSTIPVPKTATEEHWKELPFFFIDRNEGRQRWKRRFEPDYYQDNIKDLYRMANEVDTCVGNVIKELKKQNVYDSTLIIFTTDNGNLHGEHGLAEKWYPFEESIRVPLVIQDPRMSKEVRGTLSMEWTLNIDLPSTLLGAAQIQPSSFMQGRDIANLYLDKGYLNGDYYSSVRNNNQLTKSSDSQVNDTEWRKDWFYEFVFNGDPITAEGSQKFWIDASFALVNKEWKYIYWPQHDYEQLFHRSLDPYDEWDLIKGNVSNIQTTIEIYNEMKDRYTFLKEWAQSGKGV